MKAFLLIIQLMLLLVCRPTLADELKRFGGGAPAVGVGGQQFLPAEQAFQVSSELNGAELTVRFTITPKYYLYKDRMRFQASAGNLILGQAFYSDDPEWKEDAEFGRVQVFHDSLSVTLPVRGSGQLEVSWQGCAEAGLCYPPQSQTININPVIGAVSPPVAAPSASQSLSITIPTLVPTVTYELADDSPVTETITAPALAAPEIRTATPAVSPVSTERIDAGLPRPAVSGAFDLQHNPLLALFTLWALGIGLAFTPCVLPMLPIVAGIVARQHASNARQGFVLAFAYGVGVASSYALLGALVSVFGSQANLAVWLQQPAILIGFSALFAILALASFDVFHLQLPASWQQHLDRLSQQGKAGSFFGTWLMGFFSALVVSPCMSAPLAGVLLSVSTLGDPYMGASALFALGLGLSTPLMLLGASEGKFMPKAGLWLNRVKQFFGILLLAVSVVMLARVITNQIILVLWAALSVGTGFWLNQWGGKWRLVWRSGSYILLIWGVALLAGAALGSHNPLQPLDVLRGSVPVTGGAATAPAGVIAPSSFKIVHSQAELDALVTSAYADNQKLLVDFYADWCISCKIIDREVFADADVQTALKGWVLVRADITGNSKDERALLQHFQIFGPPAILFFEQGLELSQARIVGEISRDQFLQHLQQNFPGQPLR